jgi:hypothetical protein
VAGSQTKFRNQPCRKNDGVGGNLGSILENKAVQVELVDRTIVLEFYFARNDEVAGPDI